MNMFSESMWWILCSWRSFSVGVYAMGRMSRFSMLAWLPLKGEVRGLFRTYVEFEPVLLC